MRSDPYRGASNRAGRNNCVNQVAPKVTSRAKRIAESWECRAGLFAAKATPTSPTGTDDDRALRGLRGRMPGKNAQRQLGTTRGSPRRTRTAKASRISRHAAKSQCAREWGGWGRISDDGPGHYNPD